MKKIKKSEKPPITSLILNTLNSYDYCDSYQITGTINESIDNITTRIFSVPTWVDAMMRFRNIVVSVFGLKGGDKRNVSIVDNFPIGSKAIYFTVVDRNDREIVMAENDKHLNFKVSILMDDNELNQSVSLTTLVKYNNRWGWIYFQFIAPFHAFIIKSLLRRAIG